MTNLKSSWPVFTDHALVLFTISSSKSEPEIELKRDWRHYTKEKLNHELAQSCIIGNLRTESVPTIQL